jgi:hypothetical protein
LWICIGFSADRDPYLIFVSADPDTDPDPDPDPGLEKKIIFIFLLKFHKGRPSHMRSIRSSKEKSSTSTSTGVLVIGTRFLPAACNQLIT